MGRVFSVAVEVSSGPELAVWEFQELGAGCLSAVRSTSAIYPQLTGMEKQARARLEPRYPRDDPPVLQPVGFHSVNCAEHPVFDHRPK